jgi:hypothetical protein
MRISLPFITVLVASSLSAQQVDSVKSDSPPKIQDNSFLVEEAYNQEAGVVQHLMTFQTQRGSRDYNAAFGQEWPVGSIRHQLSYDLPFARLGSESGIGDVGVNYRYQLTGDGNTTLAIAPRVSVILPTGDWKQSRGNGAVGLDLNLPVSYVLSPDLVTHVNAGMSVTPSARNVAGQRARIQDWTLGQSLIVTRSSVIQPMLEVVYSRGQEVIGEDRTASANSFVIAPGIRSAFNFASGLQIVPGVAVPLGVGSNSGERGLFLYLSIEHSFTR